MYKIYNQDILSNGTIKKDIIDLMKSLRIKSLNCENMVYLKQVPKIMTLEYLIISNCSKIKQLPNIPKLKILICNDTGLEKLPRMMPNLDTLDCSGCRNLKDLPIDLPKLKYLNCSGCRVPKIHNYEKLEFLDCSLCNKVNKMPYLPNLEELKCDNSFMIKKKIRNIEDYNNWIVIVKKFVSMLKTNKISKDVIRKMYEEYF